MIEKHFEMESGLISLKNAYKQICLTALQYLFHLKVEHLHQTERNLDSVFFCNKTYIWKKKKKANL